MQVPTLSIELAKSLEQSEADLLTSRLAAVGERDGNPMGVKIRRFGNATVISVRNVPARSYNTVLGMGPEEIDYLDDILAFYQEIGVPCQFEISPAHSDPDLLHHLAARGFGQTGFHTVLYGVPTTEIPAPPPGVTIREIREDEFDLYAELYAQGFEVSTIFRKSILVNTSVLYGRRNWKIYIASIEGQPAAIGLLYMKNGIASLNGAATVPEFRRRGLQTALLHRRLLDAATAGCRLVAARTTFGSNSQQNMQRLGLQVAYTKSLWNRSTH